MTTQNKAVTCYLPKDIEDFITGYCNEYGITRKDKEGHIYPSLGTGIIELLKLLAYNPELVSSPLPNAVPKSITDDAIANSEIVKNIQSRLDNMELLLKLQQSASIASPIPTGEPSPLPPPDRPAIDSLFGDTSPATPPSLDAIENAIDTAIKPAIENVIEDTLGTGSETEIASLSPSATKEKGLTDSELARLLKIDKSNITRWKQRGKPTPKYKDWELIGRLWYKKSETKD